MLWLNVTFCSEKHEHSFIHETMRFKLDRISLFSEFLRAHSLLRRVTKSARLEMLYTVAQVGGGLQQGIFRSSPFGLSNTECYFCYLRFVLEIPGGFLPHT